MLQVKRSRLITAALAVPALLLLAVLPAAAQTFAAGNDALNTQAAGNTQVDLSQFPAVLTALGSTINGGDVINLQGVSLSSSMGPSVDTIVARGAISSGSGSLTIAALNMASVSPLQLADGRQYNLQVCLSDTAQTAGSIALTQANNDGGTFNSSIPILPKLVFTNVSNSSDVLTIDCASGGCGTGLTVTSTGTGYAQTGGTNSFNPSAEGINSLPTGSQTVANCGGTHTITINAPGGFYPGWSLTPTGEARRISAPAFRATGMFDASRSQPQATTGYTFTNTGTFDQHAARHKTQPPLDCYTAPGSLPSGGRGTTVNPQLGLQRSYCFLHISYDQY
jgi:hypothetical protein